MRLEVVVLLDIDHAADHAYRRSHEHVVTHLVATKLVARAARKGRRTRPSGRHCGHRILELNIVSSRHPLELLAIESFAASYAPIVRHVASAMYRFRDGRNRAPHGKCL